MVDINRSASAFSVGEEINPESFTIRLRVTAIDPENDTLEAVVIKAEGFFAESLSSPVVQEGFAAGMELVFECRRVGCWVARKKGGSAMNNLPWFELLITSGGRKSFDHYR